MDKDEKPKSRFGRGRLPGWSGFIAVLFIGILTAWLARGWLGKMTANKPILLPDSDDVVEILVKFDADGATFVNRSELMLPKELIVPAMKCLEPATFEPNRFGWVVGGAMIITTRDHRQYLVSLFYTFRDVDAFAVGDYPNVGKMWNYRGGNCHKLVQIIEEARSKAKEQKK
jgi:hypothetical protein